MTSDKCIVISGVLAVSTALSDPIGPVRLKGYLGERLDAMIERHVMATDIDYITAPFLEKTERKNLWQTEFWGKFMHAAVPFAAYADSDALRAKIERGIDRILGSQEPCGYIGNYPDELRMGEGWDVWGVKYTLMGLIHYYDGTRSRSKVEVEKGDRALVAARRLCDYVIAEIGPNGRRGRELWQTGNWSGFASSSILEPVVWLYRRTKERRYLDFASFVVKGITEPESGPRLIDLALKGVSVADRNGFGNVPDAHGGYVSKSNRWKSYEMMSCYQGLLDYVEAMGDEDHGMRYGREELKRAAILAAEDIAKEEVNLAGGCSACEAWFHGATKQHLAYFRQQETCVTTTWMRLCEKLLSMTDDPKWADRLEQTFYNAYLAAMKADGSEFGSYTPLSGSRYHGHHHCHMHTGCCMANGPRGFLCFLRKLYEEKEGVGTFNFYASAIVNGFDMYALYPRTDTVRIVSHKEGRFKLRLRIPAWCEKTIVKLNGSIQDGVRNGSYFSIDRTWRLGDIVEIVFDMPVLAHVLNEHLAFTRGPVLLARDSRFHDGDLMEPFRHGIRNGQVMASFVPVRTPSDVMWMAFSAVLPVGAHNSNPEGALPGSISFCDYASAGNTWNRDDYYRTWFPVEIIPKVSR